MRFQWRVLLIIMTGYLVESAASSCSSPYWLVIVVVKVGC